MLAQEDDKLRDLVAQYGPNNWTIISNFLPGRVNKQCRERYVLGAFAMLCDVLTAHMGRAMATTPCSSRPLRPQTTTQLA